MKRSDKDLGMDRSITRRDFLNGATAATAMAAAPGSVFAFDNTDSARYYPPALTGLRGSHVGSYEVAHQLAWQGKQDWGRVHEPDEDAYDLVVVGAGVSGLAAAYFYREHQPGARVLILDNHDDFGGHAKRNEFSLNGEMILAYGGSQALEAPAHYSAAAKTLLRDLDVDVDRFETLYDQDFFNRHGLAGATYFDADTFGSERLVNFPLVDYSGWLRVAAPAIQAETGVDQMPLAEKTRGELLRLLSIRGDRLSDVAADQQENYLWTVSYRDFLERHLGVSDPGVLQLLQGLTADSTVSIEATEAMFAIGYTGLPGLKATALTDYYEGDEPYIYHFPDGNASIARLLVRKMNPRVAPGSTMDDVVLADFDYSQLDSREAEVRIRLDSTAVRIEHVGSPENATQVEVTYVNDGRASRVRGRACIMAGYNALIPNICPELGVVQAEALSKAVKSPIIYTNVLLRNWRAWEKLGVGIFGSPAAYYAVAALDFPVSMGGYKFSKTPDDPIVVHMERFAKGDVPDASPREQRLAGRREMFGTSFETIERETRKQLAGALAEGGFDPAEDIAAITVNRWGHGYANWGSPFVEEDFEDTLVAGRRRLGRIAIANSDAGGDATIDAAIDQAYRAVAELVS